MHRMNKTSDARGWCSPYEALTARQQSRTFSGECPQVVAKLCTSIQADVPCMHLL